MNNTEDEQTETDNFHVLVSPPSAAIFISATCEWADVSVLSKFWVPLRSSCCDYRKKKERKRNSSPKCRLLELLWPWNSWLTITTFLCVDWQHQVIFKDFTCCELASPSCCFCPHSTSNTIWRITRSWFHKKFSECTTSERAFLFRRREAAIIGKKMLSLVSRPESIGAWKSRNFRLVFDP